MFRGTILGRFFRMNKICSSFLVVERKYWTFGVNFLSIFSKLQPTVAAERFDVFLEGRVFVWSFSVSERKKPCFDKKYMALGSVAKSAFHVSSAKLWEKMTKVINTIIISFGTLSEFFLILTKKNSQVCRNGNQVYRAKIVKKYLEKLVFRFSWNLTRKTCSFTAKFLAALSNILSTCPEEPLKSNISERKSWKLQDFRLIFEVFGTMAEIFFQGWQSTNRCPREHFMKTFFQKRDFRYFFRFWAIFLLLAKTFAWFAIPAI